MSRIHSICAAFLLVPVLAFVPAKSQGQASSRPTFADRTPLELMISAPFRQLSRDQDDRPEYDSVIELAGPDGQTTALDISIRIRGNSRVANCAFPPLSLSFRRAAVAGTVFEGQSRLKLVTLCKRNRLYRDYLAQEYLIYRMLNALTDQSFRVRWATVEYVDSDRNRRQPVVEPAFLIEADWEVAERLGMQVVETDALAVDTLDPQHTVLLALFQYLIGNTDWAVLRGPEGEPCCHNGKVIRAEGGPYIVLPYDFDSTGLIDAEYTAPSQVLPIRSVTQRLYRGFCSMNDGIEGAITALDDRRESLIGVFDDELLSQRGQRSARSYLEDSFEIINDATRREGLIYEACRR